MGALSLRVLSDGEIERVHEKTLEVLGKVGAKITHEGALRRLAQAGARVEEASGVVRFPREMVGELLALAPQEALYTGLNGKLLRLGGERRYYLSLILDPVVVDYETGLRRPVLEDVRRHTILGESLDRVGVMMRMQYPVSDVPEPECYDRTMEVFLSHTTKHVSAYPTSVANCRRWMDAAAVIAEAAGLPVDATPLVSVAMAVTSPLQIHGPNIEIMRMAMERCYPIISTVCPMAGTTAPYSVAGTVLSANVEALLPVLIAQVFKPGHPVLYAIGPSVTDMRSGHDLYYRVEKMLFKLAGIQMGKYYRLPIAGEAGGTLTHRADVQNGAESMLYLLASVAAGQNLIGGLGSLYNANGMSAEQIVMQCGLADMAEYVARGIDLSDEKLAVDSLLRTGPGGNFLTDDLTLKLLRTGEFFDSPLVDLTGGYAQEAPGMLEIAHRKVVELVENYRPTVPGNVREAIARFFKDKPGVM
jgi:trimethylamine--corrinoid protein Co-methyltransferase